MGLHASIYRVGNIMASKDTSYPNNLPWPKFVADVEKRLKRLYADPAENLVRSPMYLPTTIALVMSQRPDVKKYLKDSCNTNPEEISNLIYKIDLQAHKSLIFEITSELDERHSDASGALSFNNLERPVELQSQGFLDGWRENIKNGTMQRRAAHITRPITATEMFLSMLEQSPTFEDIYGIIKQNQEHCPPKTTSTHTSKLSAPPKTIAYA